MSILEKASNGFHAPMGQVATGATVTGTGAYNAIEKAVEPVSQCLPVIFSNKACWMESLMSVFPWAEACMFVGLFYTLLKLKEHFTQPQETPSKS